MIKLDYLIFYDKIMEIRSEQIRGSGSSDNRRLLQTIEEFGGHSNAIRRPGLFFVANNSKNILQNDENGASERGAQIGLETQSISVAFVRGALQRRRKS